MQSNRRKVKLISQGVWDMPLESMPLASGYIKASADQHEDIRESFDIEIYNFRGGQSVLDMVKSLFFEEIPDIIAFSTLGWNYQAFGRVAETFRGLNPSGWIVMGGNHVTNQRERVFENFPCGDIVANGEGELTF